MGWDPEPYLETAVRQVLSADPAAVDDVTGHAALLLAGSGHAAEADRLVVAWSRCTERPVQALAADPVRARAWAMLFAARGARPDWAKALTPLDPDDEEAAQRAYLTRRVPAIPADAFGDSTVGRVVAGLAGQVDQGHADPMRTRVAEAEKLAAAGDEPGARAALRDWAVLAGGRGRPDMAMVAACRHLAALLVAGADPLALGSDGANRCGGELVAALRARHPSAPAEDGWPGLLRRIMRLREADPDGLPGPASAEAVSRAEQRIGAELPGDYRGFLRTCDGLPADVVFPRLLGAAELTRDDQGTIAISETGLTGRYALVADGDGWQVLAEDELFGTNRYHDFRTLLVEHVQLLEDSRELY
jgi:hypothetical protein